MSVNEISCKIGADGMYCHCFRNQYGLSREEITEIFSRYGNVVCLRSGNNERHSGKYLGYYFVRYRHLEEARRCAEGLRGHPKITLQTASSRTVGHGEDTGKNRSPQGYRLNINKSNGMNGYQRSRGQNQGEDRPNANGSDRYQRNREWNTEVDDGSGDANGIKKHQGNKEQNTGGDRSDGNAFNSYQRNIERNMGGEDKADADESNNCQGNGENNEAENRSNTNGFNKFQKNRQQYEEQYKLSRGKNSSHIHGLDNEVNESNDKQRWNGYHSLKKDDQNQNLNNVQLGSDSFDACMDETTTRLMELHLRRGIHANTFKAPKRTVPQDDQPSQNDLAVTPILTNNDDMPSLVGSSRGSPSIISSNGRTIVPDPLEPKIVTIMAQDVIVGNMHPNSGVTNIYSLFKRFNPIYVSDVEMVPDTGVRFCHVYFTTPEDALNAEFMLDRHKLFGNELLVLRSHKLEELARSL